MTPERVRDVPASCLCTWEWRPGEWRWVRITARPACPWHAMGSLAGMAQGGLR